MTGTRTPAAIQADEAFNRVAAWYAQHQQHPKLKSKDREELFCAHKVNAIRVCIKKNRNKFVTARYQAIPGWADSVYSRLGIFPN